MIVVPVTFLLFFMLRFATFQSAGLAALVFTGVAVLNGLVLVVFIGQFRKRGEPLETAVYQGPSSA